MDRDRTLLDAVNAKRHHAATLGVAGATVNSLTKVR